MAYYRVSTQRQGRSGLGLDAQKEAVRAYLNGGAWNLVSEVVEVESGKRSDRPQLAEALRLCRRHKATLIIAKLDRLARNVAFTSNLMESSVEFIAVDNPHATRLTIHVLAAVAEHEAVMISARTKAALAQAKLRGVNRTKLGMEQLQLGVSYAANVARDSGVSFTELTATLGGMAQAGIRSGSTLGTGPRQFMQELVAPTDKLKDALRAVGLTMADVDLRANGLIGVIENMRRAGFGGAEALRAMDLRGASAYTAMLGQIDTIRRLGGDLTLSNAAAEGAAKANESLSASLTRFGNVSFAILDKSLRPMVTGLTGAVDGAAALTAAADKLGAVLPVVGTGLGAIAIAATALQFGRLATSLAPLLAGLANPAVLAVAAAGAALGGAAYLASRDQAKEALDGVRAVRNEVQAQAQTIETGISGVDAQLGLLMERRERLNADPVLRRNTILEAQKAFGDLGLSISANAASIDELIAAYRRLRTELQGQNTELLQRQFAVTAKELDALIVKSQVDRRSADQRIADALGGGQTDYADPRFPVKASAGPRSDDAGLTRAGLSALKPLLDVIRNPASLGQDDPLGVSRFQQIILDERQRLEREAAPLRLDASDPRRLAAITDTLDRLDKIAVLFADAVKTNAGTVAAQGKLSELSARADVSRLQQAPEFQAFGQRSADLQANLTERTRAVEGSGTERKAGIVAAIRDTQAEAARLPRLPGSTSKSATRPPPWTRPPSWRPRFASCCSRASTSWTGRPACAWPARP